MTGARGVREEGGFATCPGGGACPHGVLACSSAATSWPRACPHPWPVHALSFHSVRPLHPPPLAPPSKPLPRTPLSHPSSHPSALCVWFPLPSFSSARRSLYKLRCDDHRPVRFGPCPRRKLQRWRMWTPTILPSSHSPQALQPLVMGEVLQHRWP